MKNKNCKYIFVTGGVLSGVGKGNYGDFGDVGFGMGVVDGTMRVMGGAVEGVKFEWVGEKGKR